jgi:hypothetical protein
VPASHARKKEKIDEVFSEVRPFVCSYLCPGPYRWSGCPPGTGGTHNNRLRHGRQRQPESYFLYRRPGHSFLLCRRWFQQNSLGSFPPDNLGIIKTGNIDEFFGTVDTNNGDTLGRDVVATWVFDISGASILSLSIDMGAMGDFEAANDFFNWSYSIDGGPAQTAFQSSVDEAGTQDYTMEGGLIVTLSDPMLVNGVLLNNNLQTQTAALAGSGNQLTLILTANTDGGSEAIAFQNIVISGALTRPMARNM